MVTPVPVYAAAQTEPEGQARNPEIRLRGKLVPRDVTDSTNVSRKELYCKRTPKNDAELGQFFLRQLEHMTLTPRRCHDNEEGTRFLWYHSSSVAPAQFRGRKERV
jgi:hypothetical protein